MSAVAERPPAVGRRILAGSALLDFELPAHLEAAEPPEERGAGRDDVRMLVSWRGDGRIVHSRFTELGRFLVAGDLLVVNTSATVAASLDGQLGPLPVEVHLSGRLMAGLWAVEVRRPSLRGSEPWFEGTAGAVVRLAGGGTVELLAPLSPSASGPARLWVASIRLPTDVNDYLRRHGRPIRYGYVTREWDIGRYQTVFGFRPGSAEMPSAARPFTPEIVSQLVAAGVAFAPLLLHTGVSSPESHEPPYPEQFEVGRTTAARVNDARREGQRVIAIGTTAVRALETVADDHGVVHPGAGWTETIVTPERGVRVVDGLLTGWHEPQASHLAMLEAIASRTLLEASYRAALEEGYLWHEFGDVHLILP
jgi:S-adenosylmethionine:tRNA ribosyltransferase-isomerase